MLKLTREQLFNLDQELSLDTSLQTILELELATQNQQVKFTLRIKSSEMLRNRAQFSQEQTSKQSLVWLIQLSLKEELNQSLMK
jgi:hypothetical protein